MKVSDYIADFLYTQGVRHVFEVTGGMVAHLIDSIHRRGKIELISMHHEQAAAFAADGAARMTGIPGVALATSGPGATNLLTGIGSCFFDSVPAVYLTGQVNRDEQKGSRQVRQLGFQETDIVSVAGPLTKAAWQARSPEEIPRLLENAWKTALSGRQGPVLLDIPMDVQRMEVVDSVPLRTLGEPSSTAATNASEEILDALIKSQRPLILAGGGVRSAQAVDLVQELATLVSTPVVNSLMGVDVLPYAHPLRVGMIGTYGNRWANLALGHCDFLLVLGSRLDIRQTGSDTVAFMKGREIHHVDCDAGEINNRLTGCRDVVTDLHGFLVAALQLASRRSFPARDEWHAEVAELKRSWPDTGELRGIPGINPNHFMRELAFSSPTASAFVVDVGQHQMWAAQSLQLRRLQRFITSGGMGAMGYALPAAIGVSLASHRQPVVMIAGDGGFQLNIQELETVAHHRLPIKMIIVNNRSYGMIRQFQDSYFDKRYASSCWGYSAPAFAEIAKAYGVSSCTISSVSEINKALAWLWRDPCAPNLLEVVIDIQADAVPKIAFGGSVVDMEPRA